jgi:hypothetical protein
LLEGAQRLSQRKTGYPTQSAGLAGQREIQYPGTNRKGQGHNGGGCGIIGNRGSKKRNGPDQ